MFQLSNIRRVIGAAMLILGTLFLLNLPFLKASFFGLFPKMQVVPAVLAGSAILLTGLLALTLLFGRLYCSVICPLGIFQDLIINRNKKRISKNKEPQKKRRKYQYEKPQNVLRYLILGLSILSFALGSTAVLIFFDPYSIYTRISTYIFHPVGISINNLLAKAFNSFENYSFVTEHYIAPTFFTLIITVLITATVVFLAIKKDRFWCNAICPVGTLLGLISRISLFRVAVNKSSCVACGKCSRECKSHAIDNTNGFKIDYSRCISCYNCIDSCDIKHAIKLIPATQLKAVSNSYKPKSELKNDAV